MRPSAGPHCGSGSWLRSARTNEESFRNLADEVRCGGVIAADDGDGVKMIGARYIAPVIIAR